MCVLISGNIVFMQRLLLGGRKATLFLPFCHISFCNSLGYFGTSLRTFHSKSMNSVKKVLLTRNVPAKAVRMLESCKNISLVKHESDDPISRAELLKQVAGKDGLCCLLTENIDAELLDRAGPQLRIVSTMSVGYDHIRVEECKRRGILIGNTPGVLTDATADLTVALLLSVARRIVEAAAAVKDGSWGTWGPMWMCGVELAGSSVGIIGLGRIGVAVAQRLKAFGISELLYTGRSAKPDLGEPLGAEFVDMDQLLARSDFVIVACALTEETREMCNKSMFQKMKRNAIFINSSRGGVVNQEHLYDALKSNTILGAGLDVTVPEPLSKTHKLLTLKNCVILPHIGSATMKTREAMAVRMAENMIAFAEGKNIPYPV